MVINVFTLNMLSRGSNYIFIPFSTDKIAKEESPKFCSIIRKKCLIHELAIGTFEQLTAEISIGILYL